MSLKKTALLNVTAGWIERVVSTAATFIVVPILLSHFGKFEYGLWTTIGQGAAILMLSDFGIANSVARFISRNYALHDNDENIRVFSTAMALFFLASFIVLAVTGAVLPFIPGILKVEASYYNISRLLFGLIGLNIALTFPLRVGRGLLQAKERYDVISLYGTLVNFANVTLIVLIFGRGTGSLLLLAIITLGLNLISETAMFVSSLRQNPDLSFRRSMITKKNFNELTSLGASSMVQTGSGFLYRNGLIFTVGMLLGVSSAPLFSIPHSILMRLGPFINRLGATLTPVASRLDASEQKGKLQNLNMLGVRYGLAISLPLGIFLLFYSRELLTFWLGRSGVTGNDISLMSGVLAVVLIPFIMGAPQMASRSILGATGKHWLVANTLFFSSLFGLIVAVIMMRFTHIGIMAAAAGMALKYVIADMTLLPLFICWHLKIPVGKYFTNVYVRPLISALVLTGACYALKIIFRGTDIMSLAVAALLFAVLSCLLIIYVIVMTEHRAYLYNMMKQRIAGSRVGGPKDVL